mmetsp:Transcript_4903/g.14779  ORF Transcript_4903/g.14779 Transcript_4903/m.14779 type:complete len:231 (+) Transcript_4903:338-1030(+)
MEVHSGLKIFSAERFAVYAQTELGKRFRRLRPRAFPEQFRWQSREQIAALPPVISFPHRLDAGQHFRPLPRPRTVLRTDEQTLCLSSVQWSSSVQMPLMQLKPGLHLPVGHLSHLKGHFLRKEANGLAAGLQAFKHGQVCSHIFCPNRRFFEKQGGQTQTPFSHIDPGSCLEQSGLHSLIGIWQEHLLPSRTTSCPGGQNVLAPTGQKHLHCLMTQALPFPHRFGGNSTC